MNYTVDQVNQVIAFAGSFKGFDHSKSPIYMTPEVLLSWTSAVALQSAKGKACLVVGLQAIISLASQDWFVRCFDITESDIDGSWCGSIFGCPVFVVSQLMSEVYNIPLNRIYVISDDGRTAVSQALL